MEKRGWCLVNRSKVGNKLYRQFIYDSNAI